MKKSGKTLVFVLSLTVLLGLTGMALAANGKGEAVSAQHKSEVAKIVQTLTDLAGKDKNIGQEISQIASAEATTTEEMTAAIKKVESRGGFKTFLIGTDYKNIGIIRSTLVTTANHIARLQRAMASTTDELIKTDLQTQIAALQATQDQVTNFVKTNESKFSLLGWLVRLFSR